VPRLVGCALWISLWLRNTRCKLSFNEAAA
jgi:hypothetical protein